MWVSLSEGRARPMRKGFRYAFEDLIPVHGVIARLRSPLRGYLLQLGIQLSEELGINSSSRSLFIFAPAVCLNRSDPDLVTTRPPSILQVGIPVCPAVFDSPNCWDPGVDMHKPDYCLPKLFASCVLGVGNIFFFVFSVWQLQVSEAKTCNERWGLLERACRFCDSDEFSGPLKRFARWDLFSLHAPFEPVGFVCYVIPA